MYKTYDILIIGGGISACTFISDYLRRGFNEKIGIIEMGRNLGGRCSSKNSSKN
tara:strand:- start:7 stop:168 length:162 start_codon:yes stop_codon:yes gene_type:complete